MRKAILFITIFCSIFVSAFAQRTSNKPEVEQSFMDMGFGMFIHWSVDSQLGAVISHSLSGASYEYRERFFKELPLTFNPKKFDPDSWAALAKLAGMKYVVFTTKHHSGFCMFDTKTTDFNIMNTPFKRDVTKEIVEAFRKQGIAIGFYLSPEDFWIFHKQNIPVGRLQNEKHYPMNNAELMEHDKQQLKELLTHYGKIDILFFDGPAEGLKEYAWQLQPDIMVTRGQIQTPEQNTPDKPLPGPWESCYTMGTDWQYKPTNDVFKTGKQVINMLIEIRAKGGNFLLNMGPKPDGEIRIEEESLLREVALWNFANRESIHNVRPWHLTHEGNIWFTASKDNKTVYAFVTNTDWKYGERKEFVIKSLKGNSNTKVSILGYDSKLVEYRKNFDASIYVDNSPIGLTISAVNGQRFYTNNKWDNPVVFKIENVDYKSLDNKPEIKSGIDGAL
jgi:alpha-L-fucosidase